MFASPNYSARPQSPASAAYTNRRPSSPTPRPFSAVGAGRRGSFSCSTGSNYTFARGPSPARTATRAPSPVRPESWATPRYVPAGPPMRNMTPPPGHRRRPSFDQPAPTPASWGGSRGAKSLEIHGDSFVGVFEALQPGSVRIVKHKGASAKGLNNLQSTLGVGQKLLKQLETTRPTHVLLMFGHVDLHINYLWQLKARGHTALKPSEWVRSVCEQYTAFLVSELLPRFDGVVYVAAVTPPIVEDDYLEICVRKYTEAQKAALPPLSHTYHAHDMTTRRAMVRAYNQILGNFCSRHPQLEFVNINRHLTLGGGDKVDLRYIDPVDPTNIHLLWEPSIVHWVNELPPLRNVGLRDNATLARNLEAFKGEKRRRMSLNRLTKELAMR